MKTNTSNYTYAWNTLRFACVALIFTLTAILGCTDGANSNISGSDRRPMPSKSEIRQRDLINPARSDLFLTMCEKGYEQTPEILKLAESKEELEHKVGLLLLGQIGDKSYPGVQEVIRKALDDRDDITQDAAITAVRGLSLRELLPKVREIALTTHDNRVVLFTALDCLAKMPHPDSIPVLQELIEKKGGEDSTFWVPYLREILSFIKNMGEPNKEAFLNENARLIETEKGRYILYGMASTGNSAFLKYIWPVIERIGTEGNPDPPSLLSEILDVIAILATYDEAEPILRKLVERYPSCEYSVHVTLDALKYKKKKQKQ